MNKYIKIALLSGIIIFIVIAVVVTLNSYNRDVLNEAEKAFNIIDNAFREERPLTEAEEMDLESFLSRRDSAIENYDDLKGKEKEDATLLYAVGDLYDQYLIDMEAFKSRYQEVKILLDK